MKLYWSPRSPFARKVMIAAHETGMTDQIEQVQILVALHLPPGDEVLAMNPLGKIPALITPEGDHLWDSRVICEYLDMQGQGGLFPANSPARFEQLRLQALADGVTDILLIWRTELTREAGPWTAVTEGWRAKVTKAMQGLEAEAEALANSPFGIGHIALIAMLGQMDFRWPGTGWRQAFPALAQLEATLAQRPSALATRVPAELITQTDPVTEGHLIF